MERSSKRDLRSTLLGSGEAAENGIEKKKVKKGTIRKGVKGKKDCGRGIK